jgi:hypothetical protein
VVRLHGDEHLEVRHAAERGPGGLMRRLAALALLLLLSAPAWAADRFVDDLSTSCNPGAPGNGDIGTPYQSLPWAMHNGSIACGDVVYLRSGTYQYAMGGSVSDGTPGQVCDDDENDDKTCSTKHCNGSWSTVCTGDADCVAFSPATCAGSPDTCSTNADCPGGGTCSGSDKTDGSHAVLPIFKDCSAGTKLIIQNYPGEDAILDGSDTLVSSATWTKCDNETACGTVTTGLNLDDDTCDATPGSICDKTYWTTSLNFGADTPQLWLDPMSATDPGTRMTWDAQATKSIPPGAFFAKVVASVPHLIVRMPDSAAPGTHTIKMAQQGGAGAKNVIMAMGASHVTVRSNPAGGHVYLKYGYFGGNLSDYGTAVGAGSGSQTIVLENLIVVAIGGRDYGIGLRTTNADNAEFRGNTIYETSSEGIGLYGGGPGGQNGTGVPISGNLVVGNNVSGTGFACKDGGATPPCLGMGIITKNCSSCSVVGNAVHAVYRGAVQVNISSECSTAACSADGALIEGNSIWDYCHEHLVGSWPPAQTYNDDCGGVTVRDSENGTVNNAVVRNNFIFGAFANPSISGHGPQGILFDATSGAMTGAKAIHNSIDGAGGGCIEVDGAGGASTLTMRGNALNNCSAGGSFCNGQVCDVYNGVPASWTVTHTNNTFWAASGSTQVIRQNAGAGFTRDTATSYEASAVQVDPLFTSATDLHLRPGSLLVNSGTATDAPPTDVDGQNRIGLPDGGADEVYGASGLATRRVVLRAGP